MGRPIIHKKISGIYQIQSKIKPERIYIGGAVNIQKRWWSHLSTLRNNKHENSKLQNHFNKYGESDLQFSILLGCEKEDLIRVEQYFLDSYNPFFNILKIACLSTGHTSYWKGKKTGRVSSTVFKKGHIPSMKGKHFEFKKRKPMPEKQKEKIRQKMMGKKNALKKVS
jgi:group I intron endonuclease